MTTIEQIIYRAASAERNSPVAVFKALNEELSTVLHCVFASTVTSMQRINQSDPNLVGVYDKYDYPNVIEFELMGALDD